MLNPLTSEFRWMRRLGVILSLIFTILVAPLCIILTLCVALFEFGKGLTEVLCDIFVDMREDFVEDVEAAKTYFLHHWRR